MNIDIHIDFLKIGFNKKGREGTVGCQHVIPFCSQKFLTFHTIRHFLNLLDCT